MVNLAKGFSECSLNCECECEAVRFQERGRRWVDVIMARSSTVQRLRYNVDDVKIIWWGGGAVASPCAEEREGQLTSASSMRGDGQCKVGDSGRLVMDGAVSRRCDLNGSAKIS